MNEKELNLREYWDNLEPFKDEFDIPNLPITDSESWKNFYVPKLIELGAIPKDKLIDGKTYIGDTRNTNEAVWNAKKNTFIYMRNKMGTYF